MRSISTVFIISIIILASACKQRVNFMPSPQINTSDPESEAIKLEEPPPPSTIKLGSTELTSFQLKMPMIQRYYLNIQTFF